MVNYKVTLRDREADANGRKNTKRVVIRAKCRLDAIDEAFRTYPDLRVVEVHAQDGSE
jgi:hypothetical protein